ncbi:UDP-glucose 4-epimerase, partial [Microthyrium microscopicum]
QYVLVVGGLGYIGSHTSWELLKEGYSVIILDNLSNSYKTALERLERLKSEHYKGKACQPSIEFYECDYRNEAIVRFILNRHKTTEQDIKNPQPTATGQTDIVGLIHFAAYKAVPESIQQPLRYYSNNVAGMIDFCTLMGEYEIKNFIFSSSAAVYGEVTPPTGRIPEDYCTHKTTDWTDVNGNAHTTHGGCTAITNPYGRSKWMCEAILNDLAISDPSWSIMALRYFNPIGCDPSAIIGEDPRTPPQNLMPVVIKVMTGEIPALTVFGTDWETRDGTAIRDFIHVTDLARGHLAALAAVVGASPIKGFHTFNLGTGRGQTVKEIVTAMETTSGKPIPTNPTGRREGDVKMCVAEPVKAATQLHWQTEKSLQDCCDDLMRFL